MKKLLLICALLVCGAASAETITLGYTGCGRTKQCVNIPNDSADQSSISFNQSSYYTFGWLTINAVPYNCPLPAYAGAASNVVCTANDNSTVLLSFEFTTTRTCVRTGHPICYTNWYLQSGTVVR
jgi:hypothetical protein